MPKLETPGDAAHVAVSITYMKAQLHHRPGRLLIDYPGADNERLLWRI